MLLLAIAMFVLLTSSFVAATMIQLLLACEAVGASIIPAVAHHYAGIAVAG